MEPSSSSKTAPDQSTPQVSTAPVQPENLTRELMVSLSKEIETTMTSIIAFRTRIGFGMFVGPFLFLGSFIVGAKGQPVSIGQSVSFNLSLAGKIATGVVFACFLTTGFLAAKIEEHAFDQCNAWRKLILRLRNDPSAPIAESELHVKAKPYWGYLGSFALVFVSIVAAIFIIKDAGTVESPKPAGAPTSRIEQVSPSR